MVFLLLFALLVMAVFDAAYTVRQLSLYGVSIELNPLIKALVPKFGLVIGVWASVLAPSILYAAVGWEFHWVLELYTAARAYLFGMQLYQNRRDADKRQRHFDLVRREIRTGEFDAPVSHAPVLRTFKGF
jgi:hypothetical protein